MKNQTLSLLILILIFSACSPIATEYLPMKDEVNGVSYVMGLEMRRSTVKITGIDPREGGVMQKLKYTVTSSNVDRKGALKYVKSITVGDSLVNNDTKEVYIKAMQYYSSRLGLLLGGNPCWNPFPLGSNPNLTSATSNVIWIPPIIILTLDDNYRMARQAFVPNGLYSKMIVGPKGDRFRINYDFSGTKLTITQEFIFD